MRQHVVYVLDLCLTLTFDLYVGDGGIHSEFCSLFCRLNWSLFFKATVLCLIVSVHESFSLIFFVKNHILRMLQ